MDRRKFIKNVGLGTIPIIGGTLVSCETVNDANSQSATWVDEFNWVNDIAVIETQAVNTYQAALDNFITTPAYIAIAETFRDHHNAHWKGYNAALRDVRWDTIPLGTDMDPRVSDVTDEASALKLALRLEYEAAQFYFDHLFNGVKTEPILQLFSKVFPMEMGHAVALKSALFPNEDLFGPSGLFDNTFLDGLAL